MAKLIRFMFACAFGLVAAALHAAGNLRVNLSPTAAVSAGAQWNVDGGSWQNSGTTVKGLTAGTHTVRFKNVSGWIAPAAVSANVFNGSTTTLSASYVQTASVTIALTPNSGQWRVDGGSWLASGATAANLAPGAHTIDYAQLAGYAAPSSESINLTAGQSLSLSRNYLQLAQLTITLSPTSGQWRVDGGSWLASGATAANLMPGNHTVDYAALANYDAPPSETVALNPGDSASLSRSYTPHPASVTVTLDPNSALFRVNGGAWNASGTTVANVPLGSCLVEFSDVSGYHTPAAQTLTLNAGDAPSLNITYAPIVPATLTVTLTPTSGQWRVDGGAWQASGATVGGLVPGTHQVDFAPLTGYLTPSSVSITLVEAENHTLSQTYATGTATLLVNLSPAAKWRADGGPWKLSGFAVTLASGPHYLEYQPLSGYTTPPPENLTLDVNQSLTINRTYQPIPATVTINLSNPSGQWRIYPVGGTPPNLWNGSGVMVPGLAAGSYTIEYYPVAGYVSPPTETITLGSTDMITLSRTYVQVASLTVNLSVAGAQWRIDGGPWLSSGTTASSLTPATHTVDYSAVSGYVAPDSETIALSPGQDLTISRTYTQLAQVSVTLSPTTGQWRIDGGAWQASGAAVANVSIGSHSIDYSAVANYDAPVAETVTLAAGQTLSLSRSYTPHPAQITVATNPASGQWRIYPDQTTPSGAWNASGATVSGLTPGTYDLQYSAIQGYSTPSTTSVVLQAGDSQSITTIYAAAPASLTVVLSPSSAQFRLNGGAWTPSGTTVGNLAAGTYNVDFSDVSGYTTPGSTSVTLAAGDNQTLTRTYTSLPASLLVTMNAPYTQWRVDGGAWQNSGATVSNLSTGNHIVEGTEVHGYTTPAPQTVALVGGQTTTVALNYVVHPAQLTVITYPASGQWQIFPAGGSAGQTWNASGATLTGIAPGTYTIAYTPVDGLSAPNTTSVDLAPGDAKTLSVGYTGLTAQITVALDQAAGQWRIDGGAWQAAGATLANLAAGDHLLEFAPVDGFTAPPSHTITLNAGDSINYSFRYLPATPGLFRLDLVPMNAKWRIDGGAWLASGATTGGLADGSHSIEFSDVTGCVAPFSTTLTASTNSTTQYTWSYDRQFSGVNVVLNPTSGGYRVDGWGWWGSGSGTGVDTGVPSLFEYEPIPGYPTPHSEFLEVDTPQQWITINRTYQANAGATVSVALNLPVGTWRIYSGTSSGTWQTGSATVTGLSPGTYTIEYGAVADYASPTAETFTLADQQDLVLKRNYASFPGQVTVNFTAPSGAVWNISPTSGPVDNTLRNPGDTVTNLAPGNYTISYYPAADYVAPPSEQITINSNQVVSLTRQFHHVYDVSVDLDPYTAMWRIDGGAWIASGDGVWGIAQGDHTIDYAPADGFIAPPSETITFTGTQIQLYRSYQALAQLTVNLEPGSAQWRVDGGAWQASGATVTNLAIDVPHTIDYAPTTGYVAPPSETVTLYSGQQLSLYRDYSPLAQITVNLEPASAQWRVDGGAWQASGAIVANLSYDGTHTIDYAPAPGYVAPPSETVTLSSGQQLSLYRDYSPLAQISVNLEPASAQWRVDGGAWQASGAVVANLSYDGTHTIDYAPATGYVAPPSETVTLYSGQQLSLYRNYSPLAQLTVNLEPGSAQWRVDGGAWQASGATVVDLAYDTSHTIDYAAVDGYVAPPSETTTLYSGQQLSLYRDYSPLAQVTVNTNPSTAQWRIDGGAWQSSAATVANLSYDVPHTIEYQPTPGWGAPPPQTVTLYSGQQLSLYPDYTYLGTHRLRFFVTPELVGSLSSTDLQARLGQYASHLQQIFTRETERIITFDPQNDISVVEADPFSATGMTYPPQSDFEIWVQAGLTDDATVGTYGGTVGSDQSGAGGVHQMKWDQIYDPSTLADGSPALEQYWRQLHLTVRGLEQMFGAGVGGYDTLGGMKDLSGVSPVLADVAAVDSATPDAFWTARADYWTDPLTANAYANPRLGSPTSLSTLLNLVSFSSATQAVIDGGFRGDSAVTNTLPDMTQVIIRVLDQQTGLPIDGATVRVWNRSDPATGSTTYEETVNAWSAGLYVFSWTGAYDPFSSANNAKLVKVSAPGYAPQAQWVTIYDGQKAKADGKNLELLFTLTSQ